MNISYIRFTPSWKTNCEAGIDWHRISSLKHLQFSGQAVVITNLSLLTAVTIEDNIAKSNDISIHFVIITAIANI